jgi:hypothetical protein
MAAAIPASEALSIGRRRLFRDSPFGDAMARRG